MQTRAAPRATEPLLDGERLRAASFIVTIYGDVVEPRGGLLWMGTLIEVCARAGISETRVRTAVSRLVAAGRLEGTREGRRSFYRLTPSAAHRVRRRVGPHLRPPPRPAPGSSRCSPPPRRRPRLPRGFASVGPGVLLGPDDGRAPALGDRAARRLARRPRRPSAARRRALAPPGARGGLCRVHRPLRAARRRPRPRPAARRRMQPAGAPALSSTASARSSSPTRASPPRRCPTTGPRPAPAPLRRPVHPPVRRRRFARRPAASPSLAGPLPAETAATQRRIRELKIMGRA